MTEILEEKGFFLTKTCSKCGETKKIDEFSKRKVSKDGHRGQCKTCVSEYQREYTKQMQYRRVIQGSDDVLLFCTVCKQKKPETQFNTQADTITGFKTMCKSCQQKRWEEYSKRFEDTE